MERKDHIRHLFDKYLSGQYTKVELDELLSYFNVEDDSISLTTLIAEEMEKDEVTESDSRKVEEIAYRLENKIFAQTRPRPIIKKLKPLISAAAIFAVILLGGLYFVLHENKQNTKEEFITDVAPGHRSATLTLNNGKKITLDDASAENIITEAGISVLKTKNGELIYKISPLYPTGKSIINTLSTVKGETYQIVLSDGSRVWLNAATTLQFSANVNDQGRRMVTLLEGEAYFEVAKDKAHPFIVKTPTQEVEVLGTHFNINSYADEGLTATTLAEGSVKVSALRGTKTGKSEILVPGQQSLNANGAIRVRQADLETVLAWKEGEIYFKDATIQEVLRQVSRWYNVEIKYEGTPTKEVFNGSIKRSTNLSTVLHILELSNVHFKLVRENNITSLIVQ
ncbi:MAG: FecR domain-containing protein [Sphingobacteriaceae bacterium]|nr:FecR domain-containing protein [Sphingobacteriaceae bacterium]